MKCPVCGAAELVRDTRDVPYTYNGETTTIPAVTADFCPACNESITDLAESDRVMREMSVSMNLPPLSDEQKARLKALAAMPDQQIDTSDAPYRPDAVWIKATRRVTPRGK